MVHPVYKENIVALQKIMQFTIYNCIFFFNHIIQNGALKMLQAIISESMH